jgi:uncharacterized membrane protein
MDTIETLGNTTPSLSLIVSLIVGASIIVTSVVCKKHTASLNSENTIDYKTLLYTGVSIIAGGIALFYLARYNNYSLYEGLSIISSATIAAYVLYEVWQ